MKIQCVAIRTGGTKADIDGTEYHFEPLDDGCHVALVENERHADRFLSIADAYRVYRGSLSPAGHAVVLEKPAIANPMLRTAPVSDILCGSDVHEPSYTINGATVALGDVVAKAFAASGLTTDEWNDLEPEDRHAKIDIALDELADAPPVANDADEAVANDERDALVEQYEAKFGKKPHYRAKIETIKAELEA